MSQFILTHKDCIGIKTKRKTDCMIFLSMHMKKWKPFKHFEMGRQSHVCLVKYPTNSLAISGRYCRDVERMRPQSAYAN